MRLYCLFQCLEFCHWIKCPFIGHSLGVFRKISVHELVHHTGVDNSAVRFLVPIDQYFVCAPIFVQEQDQIWVGHMGQCIRLGLGQTHFLESSLHGVSVCYESRELLVALEPKLL